MTSPGFRFDRFWLNPVDRRLCRDEVPVELNSRYFDALTLLVSEQGRLVPKDRFMDEVWRGIPVTDEALTQCIKTLRRQLGDDAARPRFIETVPKHGYRFIAPVEGARTTEPIADSPAPSTQRWQRIGLIGLAGTIGGGFAGLVGGLFYGFVGASQPLAPGMGAVSVLLVLVCLSILVALIGGAGVALGIAAAGYGSRLRSAWTIAGGAVGGLVVGACVKLLGLDAFQLLLGQSPGDITGAAEGVILGGAVGLGAWLATRGPHRESVRRGATAAALAGACAGIVIALLGGQMMAGSLELLARSMPGSRLRFDQIGALFGEQGLGPISRLATGGLEGALFGGCVVAAMLLARRHLGLAGER